MNDLFMWSITQVPLEAALKKWESSAEEKDARQGEKNAKEGDWE